MTQRVLLGPSVLKVSKPGFDVLSTGAGGLQFSSDWAQMGTLITGTYTITWSTSGDNGEHIGSFSFGRTFPSPPAVFFDRDTGGGRWLPLGHASGFLYRAYANGGPPQPNFWVLAQVSTAGVAVNARYRKPSSGFIVPGFTFRYRVMEYNV